MKKRLWSALILGVFLTHAPSTLAGEKDSSGSKTTLARLISPAQLRADLAAHKGRVVVLHFWATWCEPCLEELPVLVPLAREASKHGIDILPVSLDEPTERNAALVGRILAAATGSPTWSPILKTENLERFVKEITPGWHGEIPAFFAFDRAGRLRHSLVGTLDPADFERLIGDLITPEERK
ncbi:MAG TPA: redoxin domain-containing protein [Polyangia bacterium]